MKIARIVIEHLLGIVHADIPIAHPVLVVTGPNGSGKSSLAESVRLALQADSPRVGLKKNFGRLVHRGAAAGMVELTVDGNTTGVHITAEGKVTDSAKGRDVPEAIPYLIDPAHFARQDPTERRAFLFRLLGLDLSAEAIKGRLLERNCDPAKVDAIAPILRSGFDAAAKHAASKATEAKGAWRATTNENYGATKAAMWRAPTPAFSGEQAAELHGLDKAIADTEAELAEANRRLGTAEHETQQAGARAQNIASLKEIAGKLDEHAKLAEKVGFELKELEDELQGAKQKAGVAPAPKPRALPCPECGAVLCQQADGSLAAYPTLPEDPPRDADAAASIPAIEKSIEFLRKVLARHTKNRDDAQTAAANLALLEKSEQAAPTDPQPIRETIATLRTSIGTMRQRQRELQEAQRKIDESDGKTKAARGHHADVLAWDAVAKALGPDGIPAEILGEAVKPFNDRLEQSAADTTWPLVQLDKEMHIRFGTRAYSMCSESERYRADIMIGEAISHLSGLKFLIADRADMLDEPGLRQMIRWAEILGAEGEIGAFIVLMTAPDDYLPRTTEGYTPENVQVVRIAGGRVVAERQMEAQPA